MNGFEREIRVFEFSQSYTRKLVEDVPDEKLAEQPLPGMNHAAWVLGHQALTADFINRIIGDEGAEPVAPKGWTELFGPGSTPVADRGRYPSKQELLEGLDRSEQAVRRILAEVPPQVLDEESPWEVFKAALPTRRDVVAMIITSHHGSHNGQLSAWRRAMGLPPVLSKPRRS